MKNFVLIDKVNLEFESGLSAFTGETGAGKSILMDAISLLKGERANAGMVKHGCDKAIIEGVFELKQPLLIAQLQEDGYDLEDGDLIITREITKEGKSTARINQRVSNVSYVKQLVSSMVDLHSQHDTQYLLNSRYHLSLLDNFLKKPALKEAVQKSYHAYKESYDALQSALKNDYNEEDLEYLTFQLNEIDNAQIIEGELEELEAEQKRMLSFEKINAALALTFDSLEAIGHPTLYESFKALQGMDEKLQSAADKMEEQYYQLEDILNDLHEYADHLEYDEDRFNEVQNRIFLIHKIIRKYGGSVSSVLEKRKELETKIDSILHRQDFIMKQEQIVKEKKDAFFVEAEKLHVLRVKEAKKLSALIVKQLKDLHLPHAQFEVAITSHEPMESGIDQVEFLISMNPGEQLKALSTTASGGELSRLMLGLKTVFTSLMGIDTVIFDEIDTGVSGKVALAIGKKMKALSATSQVFCVTHLSPVAACAAQHYMVEKQQNADQTKTMIRKLTEAQRIQELANMASGSTSDRALESAKELYQLAQRE